VGTGSACLDATIPYGLQQSSLAMVNMPEHCNSLNSGLTRRASLRSTAASFLSHFCGVELGRCTASLHSHRRCTASSTPLNWPPTAQREVLQRSPTHGVNTSGPKNTTRATCAHNKPNPGMRTKNRGMPHQGHCWSIDAPFHKTECRPILRFTPSSQSMSQEICRLSAYIARTPPAPRPALHRGHHRIS
jgi:hypothetical protein